jgi:hypothetical protein
VWLPIFGEYPSVKSRLKRLFDSYALFFASLKNRAGETYQGERVFFRKIFDFSKKDTLTLKIFSKGRFSSEARKSQ